MVTENYKYWQENGAGWYDEYVNRKGRLPYFYLQEIFIAEFIARNLPAKVLEFGAGVGRHLENLRQIDGAEIFGFDQSSSMVAEMSRWASSEWIQRHVVVGEPVERLPYPDNEFDIVYTSEVLVHVNPEDVSFILSELLRVSKGVVLHLEPGKNTPLDPNAHNGCWYHDLHALYSNLGYSLERLSKVFEVQDISLVRKMPNYCVNLPFNKVTSSLFMKMERAFLPALLQYEEPQLSRYERRITSMEDHIRFLDMARASELPDTIEISLEVLPEENNDEVWIRFLRPTAEGPRMPWSELGTIPDNWLYRDAPGCMYDCALYGHSGATVTFQGWRGMEINLMAHQYSSKLKIVKDGESIVINLVRSEPEIVSIVI